jgi:RND family efflux transporter MFP subunit
MMPSSLIRNRRLGESQFPSDNFRMHRAVIVVVLLGLGVLCFRGSRPVTADPPPPTVTVQERELTVSTLANGIIESPVQANVAPVVSGEIVDLKWEEGDTIKKGEVVARLDSSTIDAELDLVKAGIQVAVATLARVKGGARPQEINEAKAMAHKAKAALDERQQDLDRFQQLYQNKAASLRELENVQAMFKMAKEEHERALQAVSLAEAGARTDDIEVARMKLEEARASLKGLETKKSKTIIVSPVNGVVVRKVAYQGEVALPGQPLLHLVSLDRLQAVLNVEETYIDSIHPGSSAEVTVDALPGEILVGKVSYISAMSSEQLKLSLLKEEEDVKRFHVKVDLVGHKGRLRAGMSVKGKFAITRKGLFVPRNAISLKAGLNMVRVATGSRVTERSVRTGLKEGNLVQILDGLSGGENLLINVATSTNGLLTAP